MKNYEQIAGIKGHVSDMLETVYNKGYAQGFRDNDEKEMSFEIKAEQIRRKIENTGIQLKYMNVDELFYVDESHNETVYKTAIMQLRNNLVMVYEMLGGELENG